MPMKSMLASVPMPGLMPIAQELTRISSPTMIPAVPSVSGVCRLMPWWKTVQELAPRSLCSDSTIASANSASATINTAKSKARRFGLSSRSRMGIRDQERDKSQTGTRDPSPSPVCLPANRSLIPHPGHCRFGRGGGRGALAVATVGFDQVAAHPVALAVAPEVEQHQGDGVQQHADVDALQAPVEDHTEEVSQRHAQQPHRHRG